MWACCVVMCTRSVCVCTHLHFFLSLSLSHTHTCTHASIYLLIVTHTHSHSLTHSLTHTQPTDTYTSAINTPSLTHTHNHTHTCHPLAHSFPFLLAGGGDEVRRQVNASRCQMGGWQARPHGPCHNPSQIIENEIPSLFSFSCNFLLLPLF